MVRTVEAASGEPNRCARDHLPSAHAKRLHTAGKTADAQPTMNDFQDKVAIVTGGGSGIGRATAIAFARDGARVVVSDVDEGHADATVRAIIGAGGIAVATRTDVSKANECAAMVERAVEHFGRLDVACNNAGIGGTQAPVADLSVADWDHVIAINLSSVFYCLKFEIPAMLRSGGGAIVNMSSILGAVGFANASAYVAAKHGMLGLTKNAALEYATQNIRVNAVGPGFIRTPMIAGLEASVLPLHPMGRLGSPEEVADLVVFLSSTRAGFITGAYYPIDGGYLAR